MSYAAPSPRRRPPAAVSAAVLIQFLIALLAVAAAVISLVVQNSIVDDFRANAAGTSATQSDIDGVAVFIRSSLIGGAIVLIVLAIGFAALAVGNLRGSQVTRIVTWVWCLFGLACACGSGIYAVSTAAADTINTNNTSAQTAEELGDALRAAYPGWYGASTGALSAVQVLGYIAVAVLLALPPATAFFRREPRPPQPPTTQWPPAQPPPPPS